MLKGSERTVSGLNESAIFSYFVSGLNGLPELELYVGSTDISPWSSKFYPTVSPKTLFLALRAPSQLPCQLPSDRSPSTPKRDDTNQPL